MLTLKAPKLKKVKIANSLDTDEAWSCPSVIHQEILTSAEIKSTCTTEHEHELHISTYKEPNMKIADFVYSADQLGKGS